MTHTTSIPMLAAGATRLILVRHGEVAANREMRYIGRREDVLTERGMEQAQRLTDALRVLPVAAVYASPRRRTYDTAEPIAAAHGLHTIVREGLRETDYGAWEGRTRREIMADSAETAAALVAWEHDPTLAPPDGESLAATDARVAAEIETLHGLHPHQLIVVVSHVGPIKSILRRTLGLPPGAGQLFLDSATISVVDWASSGGVLRLFNAHGHLGRENARWMTDH